MLSQSEEEREREEMRGRKEEVRRAGGGEGSDRR